MTIYAEFDVLGLGVGTGPDAPGCGPEECPADINATLEITCEIMSEKILTPNLEFLKPIVYSIAFV